MIVKEFCWSKQIVWMKEKTLLSKATHPKFSFESLFKSFRRKNIVAILIEKNQSCHQGEIVLEVIAVSRSTISKEALLETMRSTFLGRCSGVRISAGHLLVTP